MDKGGIANLDKMLLLLANKYLGISVRSSDLLKEIGFETITYQSLFLIEVLIADNYVIKHNTPSQTPFISIAPLGYRFIYTGGYVAFIANKTEDIAKEQYKMQLEIINLRWGLRISIVSLLFAIFAVLISFYSLNNKEHEMQHKQNQISNTNTNN
ncbi:hypothetical protein QT970_02355 [Microcoleus sp. herbarium8]